ncbi:MAG: tetratricopeptide (TPR) repeat protein [Phenylobacterium sp.]|jgi:tetratricopeptide (TPR) repeat protein
MVNRVMALWQRDKANLPLTLQVLDSLFAEQAWALAETFFQQIPPQNRQRAEVCGKHIEFLIHQHQPEQAAIEAADLYHSDDTDNHKHPIALHYLALSHYLNGELQALLDLVSSASQLTPETVILQARAYYHKGHQGDIPRAIDVLTGITSGGGSEGISEGKSYQAEVLGLLAMLYLDADMLEKVLPLAEQALALQPQQPDALLAQASYFVNKHQMVPALPVIEQLLNLQPNNGRAMSIYGQILFFDFKLDLAIGAFKQAVKFMPDHVGSWHLLGWSYFVSGQLDEANRIFNTALELDRNFAESHGALAVVAVTQQKLDQAQALAKVALRLNANSFAGLYARSLIAGQLGNQTEATAIVNNILANPSHIAGQSYQQLVNDVLLHLDQKQKQDQQQKQSQQ